MALLFFAESRYALQMAHGFGKFRIPVTVVGCIHHLSDAEAVEDVRQNCFFRLAGKADLGAADDLRRFALAERPLRAKLLKMLIESFSPEGDPTASAFHETDLHFRVAVEYALADHVHERNHAFEREGSHVDVTVFLHPL